MPVGVGKPTITHLELLAENGRMYRSVADRRKFVALADIGRPDPENYLGCKTAGELVRSGYAKRLGDSLNYTGLAWSKPDPEDTLYPEWEEMTEHQRDNVAFNGDLARLPRLDLVRVVDYLRHRVTEQNEKSYRCVYALKEIKAAIEVWEEN